MTEIPQFKIYGEDDPMFSERIQPRLELRSWSKLSKDEKKVIYENLCIKPGYGLSDTSVLNVIEKLNDQFTRRQPALNVNNLKVNQRQQANNEYLHNAARKDFRNIIINEKSEDLVLLMLSLYAKYLINKIYFNLAEHETDFEKRKQFVGSAFLYFDQFAKHLNHLFDQFGVNIVVTRSGFVPRQDKKLVKNVYEPTLEILSDPKWDSVNSIFREVFAEYHAQRYPEAITQAHNAVHQFLKVVFGEEGSSGKGQFGKLIKKAKSQDIISQMDEIKVWINWTTGLLPSERAIKGSAKPTSQTANSADALLVMNTALVLIQHCLQNLEY